MTALFTILAFLCGVGLGYFLFSPAKTSAIVPLEPKGAMADPLPAHTTDRDICYLFDKDGAFKSSMTVKDRKDPIVKRHGREVKSYQMIEKKEPNIYIYKEVP